MARPKKTKDNPNSELELDGFDYAKLQGQDFEKYQAIEDSLLMHEKYDFEMWLATSQTKFRINEDTGDKESYMNGIVLHGNKPIQLTRITAQQARELNSHVKGGALERQNSKYYLLTKSKAELAEVKE